MTALEKGLETRKFELMGSGRTDAGVHALKQVAHLDVQTQLAPHIVRMRLNDNLPADINILEVFKTTPRFHARHNAVTRTYLYQISRRRTAFGKKHVWWIKDALDIARMKQACAVFEGFNDFRSFTKDDPDEKSTTVDLNECSLHESGALILLRIRGSHFLWRMVRQMVGMIAEAGRGGIDPGELRKMLTSSSTLPAQKTAPPSGLFLEHVQYPSGAGIDHSLTLPPNPVSPTLGVAR